MGNFQALNTTYIKASFQPRYDADGTVWRQVYVKATATAKTPMQIQYDEFGPVAIALAGGSDYYYVGVPNAAAAIGDIVWLQTGGYCADVITPSLSVSVGHAFGMTTGAIVDAGADYDGNASEFAVCCTVSTTSTTQDMMLVDRMILETA